MDNVKNDTYFANKIRDDLIFIVNYTKNIDEEEPFDLQMICPMKD